MDTNDQAFGEAMQERMIEQLLEGLKSTPMMVSRARGMASRDPNMAEALRRFDEELSK